MEQEPESRERVLLRLAQDPESLDLARDRELVERVLEGLPFRGSARRPIPTKPLVRPVHFHG